MSNTPSDADIEALAQQHLKAFAQFTGAGEVWFEGEVEFARAIEAEVRKQDDALIRQLVEAMEGVKALNMGGELALWTAEFDRLLSAITAGRARLEGKP